MRRNDYEPVVKDHVTVAPGGFPEVRGGSLLGKRIAVLGAAFKPDSDEIRDSPAHIVAVQLQLQGAVVHVTDPAAIENSAACG